MALKGCSKETLVGNWYEERQPPLRGVLPDYGQKSSYETTAGSSYKAPEKCTRGPSKAAREAEREMALRKELDKPSRFGGGLHVEDRKEFRGETDHNASYGPRVRRTEVETKLQESGVESLPAAGGQPGQAPAVLLKKEPASGMIGEYLKVGMDPKSNTDSQRAWIYDFAPELRPQPERKAPEAEPQPLFGNRSAKPSRAAGSNQRQITFGLTAKHGDMQRINKISIFQDFDEPQ